MLAEEHAGEDAGFLTRFAALDQHRGGVGGTGFFERHTEDRLGAFAEHEQFEHVLRVAARGEDEDLRVGGGVAVGHLHRAKIAVAEGRAVLGGRHVAQPEMPERHGGLADFAELGGGHAFVRHDERADLTGANRRGMLEVEFAHGRDAGDAPEGFGEDLRVFLRVGGRDTFLGEQRRGGEEQGETELGESFHVEWFGNN